MMKRLRNKLVLNVPKKQVTPVYALVACAGDEWDWGQDEHCNKKYLSTVHKDDLINRVPSLPADKL